MVVANDWKKASERPMMGEVVKDQTVNEGTKRDVLHDSGCELSVFEWLRVVRFGS